MEIDASKIQKEVEDEVYDHLMTVKYGGDKLLESVENVANMVLLEYGVKESYIEVEFSSGGNISIKGVKESVEKYNEK